MSNNKISRALLALLLTLVCVIAMVACDNSQTKTHTVFFDANGGTGTMQNQTFVEGIEQNLTANAFTKEGYYFLGWATNANGTGIIYANGASFTISKDITLFAVWNENVIGLADLLAVAQTVEIGGSLTFASYYTLDILDGTYHGQMLKVESVQGKEYEIIVSDTSVFGWILCKSDGSISTYGLISSGKGKFKAEGEQSYLLIGFKTDPPSGSFTATVNEYVGSPGESEKYAISLEKGTASASQSLENYGQVWYELTIPNDGKKYGLTVNKVGATGNNILVSIFSKNHDGTANRQNYKFAYAYKNSSTAPFDNFVFEDGISASVGEGLTIDSGTYFIMIMATEEGLSCNILFTEIVAA